MGNFAYYPVARAWITPYPPQWAPPQVEGRCCFSLYLAGAAWSKPGSRRWAWASRSRQQTGSLLQHPAPERLTALSYVSPTRLCKEFAFTPGVFLPYVFSTTTVETPRKVLGKFGCVIFQWLSCHWNWQAPYPAWQEQPRGLLKARLRYRPGKAPHFPFSSSNSSESTTAACRPHAKFLFKHSCNDDLTHLCKVRFWIHS